MDYTKAEKLLNKLKNYPKCAYSEKNIFGIGARGHYENPITDVLAFFCDANEEHGFGDTILQALLSALSESSEEFSSCFLGCRAIREVYTHDGKRIDMVLEGDDWVIIVENKIYHAQNNPFNSYSDYIDKVYVNKRHLYVILSPYGKCSNSTNAKWHGLSYALLMENIEKYFSNYCSSHPISKWQIIFREFILHIKEITMTKSICQEEVSFLISHMKDLAGLEEFKAKNTFNLLEEIKKYLIINISDESITYSQSGYLGCPQVRFFLIGWKSNVIRSNVFFNFENGKMSIGVDLKHQKYSKDRQLEIAENKIEQFYSKRLNSSLEGQYVYFFIHNIFEDYELNSLKNAALKGFQCLMDIEKELL